MSEAAATENFYRYVELSDPPERVAYRDSGGDGPAVVLLHGFSAASYTWDRLLPLLPPGYRYIRPDGIGFGENAAGEDSAALSSYGQGALLGQFLLTLGCDRIILAGHAMGGEIAMLALADPAVRRLVTRLILIDPTGLQPEIPHYLEEIAATSPNATWLKFAKPEFIATLILEYAYADPARIRPETLQSYAEMLAVPGRIPGLIRTARFYRPPDRELLKKNLAQFRMPTLVVWGGADSVMPPGEMQLYLDAIPGAVGRIIPDAGHMPHEEYPEEFAAILTGFLNSELPPDPQQAVAAGFPALAVRKEKPGAKLKLSRLFDHWSFGALFMLLILKLLQFIRRLGGKAEENGWRKVTGIFLRNEYSKFMLTSFRLTYAPGWAPPGDADSARTLLSGRLLEFLMRSPELHWRVEPGWLYSRLKRNLFCDLMVARIDRKGHLIQLEPHFDPRHPDWLSLRPEQRDVALQKIISTCNRFRRRPSRVRLREIAHTLRRWARKGRGLSRRERRDMMLLVERVMAATFLFCEMLPENPDDCARQRLAMPDLKKFRHPGWGMLGIVARFTHDLKEVDLWCHFDHVSADGAPMQDLLNQLKREWGSAGTIVYPPLTVPVSRPDTVYCGEGIFRARVYVDFQPLLRLRAWLNAHFMNRMDGPASLAGILMWALAQHAFFRNKKMLLPVDMPTAEGGDRELGILVIRPGLYYRDESPLLGFINFQREMNRRLTGTRAGRSESHEFLELCSMLHPFFYHLARILGSRPLHEIVGTVGISIIRDAEMFVSPLTDFQINGFMTLGSVSMPTANGGKAGALSICGSRPQIRSYLEAVSGFLTRFPEYLRLPDDWAEELPER